MESLLALPRSFIFVVVMVDLICNPYERPVYTTVAEFDETIFTLHMLMYC